MYNSAPMDTNICKEAVVLATNSGGKNETSLRQNPS